MITLKSNVDDWEKAAKRSISGLSSADLARQVANTLEARMIQIMQEQFSTEGAAGKSGRWAELSPLYQIIKSVTHPGQTILKKDEPLFRSLTVPGHKNQVSTHSRAGAGWTYRFGTTVEYASAHQFGGDRLPKRPIFDLTKRHERGIALAIGRTIQEGPFSRTWFDRFDRRTPREFDVRFTGLINDGILNEN